MEIIEQIDEIISTLERKSIQQWTGDNISRAISRLAILKVRLGELVAEAEYQSANAYNNRKYLEAEYGLEFSRDNPVSKAQMMAEKANEENRGAEAKALRDFKLMKNKYMDVGDLITTLQSRLRYLENEKREAKTGV